MIGDNAMPSKSLRKVRVKWHAALGDPTAYVDECLLEEGYSDESNLPEMIAIRHLGMRSFADEVVIDEVTDI